MFSDTLIQKKLKPGLLPNPQTDELLSLLGLDHVVTIPCGRNAGTQGDKMEGKDSREVARGESTLDPCEIDLDAAGDPDEIRLDEE